MVRSWSKPKSFTLICLLFAGLLLVMDWLRLTQATRDFSIASSPDDLRTVPFAPRIVSPNSTDAAASRLLSIRGMSFNVIDEEIYKIFIGFVSPTESPDSQFGHIAFRLVYCRRLRGQNCDNRALDLVMSPRALGYSSFSLLQATKSFVGAFQAILDPLLTGDFEMAVFKQGRKVVWFPLESKHGTLRGLSRIVRDSQRSELGRWFQMWHSCASITAKILHKAKIPLVRHQFSIFTYSPFDLVTDLLNERLVGSPVAADSDKLAN